jgi:aspartate kinase
MHAVMSAHLKAARELFPDGPPEALETALAERFNELELILRGVALLRELSPRSMDAIASFGERLSTLLFSTFIGAPLVDARQVMLTDDAFGEAQPRFERLPELAARHFAPLLAPGGPVVTQGYIGATEDGLSTTLGRGGSDYSAALFGAALGVEEVQIWTDVQGVLTCDPRVVPTAQSIDQLTFSEAAELAAFGAKVLHPATIQPAVECGIPVTVRDTHHPEGKFTTISPDTRSGRAVTALATRGPVTVLTVNSSRMLNQSGFLARLFEVFRRHGVSVDLIATAEVSVSLTVEADAPLEALMADLAGFATVVAVQERAIIAVVGERIKQTPGVAGRVFTALGDINIELISMGANEINLSLVVPQAGAVEALRRLHRTLIEEAPCA